MLRSIISGVIALVLACAATSGVVIVRAKGAANVAADSAAKADSLALKHSKHASVDDSLAAADTLARHDSLAVHRDSAVAVVPVVPMPLPVVAQPTAPPAKAAVVPVAKTGAERAGLSPEARLPKLFAAMSSRDAAKVLDQMTDGDVIAILSGMPDKKAGEILALLPPARSATIAKQVLGGKHTP